MYCGGGIIAAAGEAGEEGGHVNFNYKAWNKNIVRISALANPKVETKLKNHYSCNRSFERCIFDINIILLKMIIYNDKYRKDC